MLKTLYMTSFLWLALSATGANAHTTPDDAQASETIRQLETVVVALAVVAYAAGVIRIRREVGQRRVVGLSQTAAFAGALTLFVVVLSPEVDEVTDALFSAHMVQHLVLMLCIPPLLVWSRPALVMIWGLPRSIRKKWRRLEQSMDCDRSPGI